MENKLRDMIPKKNQWLIVLLIGLLLVVIAIPTKSTTTIVQSEESYALDEELRLKNILEKMEGVGNVSVMITFQKSDEIEGVVVIADGGGNAVIVRNITEVVQALFDVDSHKIKVIKANQTN